MAGPRTAVFEAERRDGRRRAGRPKPRADDQAHRFHVVVLGTGPVGKTSLVNALLGRSAGETGATMGTTAHGRSHTHAVEGVEGTLLLTDTPRLGEAGEAGTAREAEAMDLALAGRSARFRRRPRPGAGRSSDGRRDGARRQAADRRAQQEGPADGGGPRRDPRQAPGAARRPGTGRGHRRGRGRPVAGPGPRPQARRHDGDHPGGGAAGPGGPGGAGGGDPRSRGRRPSAPATSCSAPAGSSGPSAPASPRIAASGPRRSSSGTSGSPP